MKGIIHRFQIMLDDFEEHRVFKEQPHVSFKHKMYVEYKKRPTIIVNLALIRFVMERYFGNQSFIKKANIY